MDEIEANTDAIQPFDSQKEHHVFCNYFGLPREGCRMCERLYAEYPWEGQPGEELIERYFPGVVLR